LGEACFKEFETQHITSQFLLYLVKIKKAVLSQGEPRDAALNCDTHRILQRQHAVSLRKHGFLAGLLFADCSESSIHK